MQAVSWVGGEQQVTDSKVEKERRMGLTAERGQRLVRRRKQERVRPSSFQDLGERDNQARGQEQRGGDEKVLDCSVA